MQYQHIHIAHTPRWGWGRWSWLDADTDTSAAKGFRGQCDQRERFNIILLSHQPRGLDYGGGNTDIGVSLAAEISIWGLCASRLQLVLSVLSSVGL